MAIMLLVSRCKFNCVRNENPFELPKFSILVSSFYSRHLNLMHADAVVAATAAAAVATSGVLCLWSAVTRQPQFLRAKACSMCDNASLHFYVVTSTCHSPAKIKEKITTKRQKWRSRDCSTRRYLFRVSINIC